MLPVAPEQKKEMFITSPGLTKKMGMNFFNALEEAPDIDDGLRNGGPRDESLFPAGC